MHIGYHGDVHLYCQLYTYWLPRWVISSRGDLGDAVAVFTTVVHKLDLFPAYKVLCRRLLEVEDMQKLQQGDDILPQCVGGGGGGVSGSTCYQIKVERL